MHTINKTFIDFDEIKKIEININEFYKEVFDYNFSKKDLQSDTFLEFMSGLILFGKMLNYASKYNLSIYEQETLDSARSKRKVYYAIDETGIIWGYIFGPSKFYEQTPVYDYNDNLYYGSGAVNEYILVKNWNGIKSTISLDSFLSNYLPLKNAEISNNNYFQIYFYLSNGEIAYNYNSKCIILPFQEFFLKKLELGYIIISKITFRDRVINFNIIQEISRPLKDDNNYINYQGSICMDTFELIELNKELNG